MLFSTSSLAMVLLAAVPSTALAYTEQPVTTATSTQKQECYTYTETRPDASCPTFYRDPEVMCPMYVKIETIEVPCAISCCPTTPTAYVFRPCPTSEPCPIPTETLTYTTGCASGAPGWSPTASAVVSIM